MQPTVHLHSLLLAYVTPDAAPGARKDSCLSIHSHAFVFSVNITESAWCACLSHFQISNFQVVFLFIAYLVKIYHYYRYFDVFRIIFSTMWKLFGYPAGPQFLLRNAVFRWIMLSWVVWSLESRTKAPAHSSGCWSSPSAVHPGKRIWSDGGTLWKILK